jgi:hypothetical protein
MIGGLGDRPPGWLSGAWQISGVLVAFGLSLVLFLMEIVISRSLRSRASYRVVVRATLVEWPLALALVFIGLIAVLKHSDPGPGASQMPSWTSTYALGFFLVQLVAFGVVFARGLGLIPPRAISHLLQRSFALAAMQATHRRLLRRQAMLELDELCEKAPKGIVGETLLDHQAFMAEGAPIALSEGEVLDIDRRLPAAIASYRAAGKTALSLSLGTHLDDGASVGRYPQRIPNWLVHELRRGVAIGARSEPAEPGEVFSEAAEYYRRAILERSPSDLELGADVIVGAFTEAARAWMAFGHPYEIRHVSDLFPGEDELMYQDLRGLVDDVAESRQARLIASLSDISYRLMIAGIDNDAMLLFEHGFRLSREQIERLGR